MARYVPQKTCCPKKGCGKDFPETAAHFRPMVGKYAGYFYSYCRKCYRRFFREYRVMARASRAKPTSEPHGAERRCKSALGCGRLLRESDFYKGQSLCKVCYKARWLPRLREKRRRASMDAVHGVADGRESKYVNLDTYIYIHIYIGLVTGLTLNPKCVFVFSVTLNSEP